MGLSRPVSPRNGVDATCTGWAGRINATAAPRSTTSKRPKNVGLFMVLDDLCVFLFYCIRTSQKNTDAVMILPAYLSFTVSSFADVSTSTDGLCLTVSVGSA
jgi:hypothetical protein